MRRTLILAYGLASYAFFLGVFLYAIAFVGNFPVPFTVDAGGPQGSLATALAANLGLLTRFVGMLTDSRSFLSYPRHEYFRRLLCDLLAKDVAAGELPNDKAMLGQVVENISFHNAHQYFGIALKNRG